MTAHDYTGWTEKETQTLLEGLANKDSYRLIANRIGVSSSAVSGKVYRMKQAKTPKAKKKPLSEVSWDRRTFETWEQRKRRLARERANVRA